ncbi:MAG: hypothetical protein BGP05_04540 [Rhizobiales bacterium 62-47]|nr:hypothetical protein [Hyphomicrobiales bacterium]OJY09017.1 MAG: hypothetical protein BGP05_04540 [Rhizobiales bacterium 62-47]
MNSEPTPAEPPLSSPPPTIPKQPIRQNVDQPVPWYGRILLAGVVIGATFEFFRLLFLLIMSN